MNLLHQKITLDVNNKSTVVINAHQGDSGTRFIDVTLTENGEVIPLSETFTATAKASLYGMVKGVNKCVLDTDDNKIVVELTETMLSTPGMLKIEISLSEGEQIITSQIFSVDVEESVLNGSTAIAENTDLAKLQRVILLVGELSKVENLDELMTKATISYNRFKEYSGEEVDLNSGEITDTIGVSLSQCNAENAPASGVVSGTVISLNYCVDEETIVQFFVMENNYTYKRIFSNQAGWSSWVKVADDLSKYLKTEDLQGLILSDAPSENKTYNSEKIETLLKGKIDTVALRGADMTSMPTALTNVQKEGTILALYSTKLFNDNTPSEKTTYSSQKIDELLDETESLSNKEDPGGNGPKHIKYPSIAYLEKYYYNTPETDTLLSGKADKSVADKNTFDLSMLLPSLVKTSTAKGVVNLTNTAQNGVLKIISDSGVTVKNQNMFEDITVNSIQKTRCNVTYDSGTYTVEYTGNENSTFFFGVNIGVGNSYASYLGEKLKYNKNLSFRINCDKLTRSGCYITYFDADGLSIFEKNYKTNTEYKIEDVEGAEFFTMRIGFDYNNGAFTTGDIFTFTVQMEYGDTVSDDFVVPLSREENLSFDGVTNVVGEGDITVQYVPDLRKLCENL
ncbi:MAG: BppU family phage baseplate upper protein [Ruminococcus sp.]